MRFYLNILVGLKCSHSITICVIIMVAMIKSSSSSSIIIIALHWLITDLFCCLSFATL